MQNNQMDKQIFQLKEIEKKSENLLSEFVEELCFKTANLIAIKINNNDGLDF